MPAGHYDIDVEQGCTFRLFMEYRDEDGVAIDLDGSDAELTFRRSRLSPGILLHTTSNNVTLVGATGGEWIPPEEPIAGTGGIALNSDGELGVTGGIFFDINAATIGGIPSGVHFYDFVLKQGAAVDRLLEGRFVVDTKVNWDNA